jgi:hypothetical protein
LDIIARFRYVKEIEWWNEITPWKNSESKANLTEILLKIFNLDFNMKMPEESNDEGKIISNIFSIREFLEVDYTEDINQNEDSMDSDYDTRRKRKV